MATYIACRNCHGSQPDIQSCSYCEGTGKEQVDWGHLLGVAGRAKRADYRVDVAEQIDLALGYFALRDRVLELEKEASLTEVLRREDLDIIRNLAKYIPPSDNLSVPPNLAVRIASNLGRIKGPEGIDGTAQLLIDELFALMPNKPVVETG